MTTQSETAQYSLKVDELLSALPEEVNTEEWQMSNDGERAVMFTNDDELFHKVIAYGCLHNDVSEMDKERVELVKQCVQWQAEPAMRDDVFDFSDDDWYQRGVDINLEIARQRHTRYGPVYNWTNRTILGHRTLMYKLKCKFNFRQIYIENNPNISGFEK